MRIFIIIFFLVACGTSNKSEEGNYVSEQELTFPPKSQQKTINITEELSPCDNDNIAIIHCEICEAWAKPKEKDIYNLILDLDTLSSYEWYDYFSFIHECGLKGSIHVNEKNYQFYLNAGGWVTLSSGDKETIVGCKSDLCKKYFHSIKLTPEEIEGS